MEHQYTCGEVLDFSGHRPWNFPDCETPVVRSHDRYYMRARALEDLHLHRHQLQRF
jgi:hypothetical protein